MLNDVKKAILQAINNITPTMLRHMLRNMAQSCGIVPARE